MSPLPRLLTWLDGLPTIEAVAPLLARIQARGVIEVRIFLPAGKFPSESAVAQELDSLGLTYVAVSRVRSKLLFQKDLSSGQAVLVTEDPALDRSSRRLRSQMVRKSGKPVIFLQHGAFQCGVNAPVQSSAEAPLNYHSDLLLLWHCAAPEAAILSTESLRRAQVCGFIKKQFLPSIDLNPALQDWTTRHAHRVLLCQSFRWRGGRYDQKAIDDWYEMLDAFLAQHRDIGVLLRPHRGKAHRRHRSLDAALMARHQNLLVSRDQEGPLRGASIHDCLALCQSVVCPESTVVLDALYMERHVMIWDTQKLIFAELPRVKNINDIAPFARDPATVKLACDTVRARYGEINGNLNCAAHNIESLITARAE